MISLKERLLTDLHNCSSYPGLNAEVLASRLSEMAQIGGLPNRGISRYVYTEEEKEAKELFKSWLEDIGGLVREDSVGNIIARFEGENPEMSVVMTGSHLDTVPDGGAFDGALGCISSLMAVEALRNSEKKHIRPIEIVVFADEEGTRFGSGLLGSRAMIGEVSKEELHQVKDNRGITIYEAMEDMGFMPAKVEESKYPENSIHAFIELHIEQGKQLEYNQEKIGIVNGIAGPSWQTVTFYGETDHAGNTPMNLRKDTVAAAGELITEIEKVPAAVSDSAVATVGKVHVLPNGSNVISGETELTIDIRDIKEEARNEVIARVKSTAEDIAENRQLEMEWKTLLTLPPVPLSKNIQRITEEAAQRHGLAYRVLPSGAGHDAMNIGKKVSAGMIFVPSKAGKSHSPEEFTNLSDCLDGIAVLKDTIEYLANE
ncbi:Zn-dependent hydrolase [Bacillus sp. FJAT-44742]|uniref:Zn-dependent hydrolase n=1 Tax=Bacillus sp. FJAT-44742 TaxID=2014005 RepID=UPI000C24E77A|nr:Zn-dependent hydrolase [Bacillus sp. FJAT-44742]